MAAAPSPQNGLISLSSLQERGRKVKRPSLRDRKKIEIPPYSFIRASNRHISRYAKEAAQRELRLFQRGGRERGEARASVGLTCLRALNAAAAAALIDLISGCRRKDEGEEGKTASEAIKLCLHM